MPKLRVAAFVCSMVVALSPPVARAQGTAGARTKPTTEELLRRIEALEHEVERLEERPCAGDAAATRAQASAGDASTDPAASGAPTARRVTGAPASPQPSSEQARDVSSEHAADGTAEPPPAKKVLLDTAAAKPAAVTAGWDGAFFVASASGDYRLRIGGMLQTDGRFFAGGSDDNPNQFVIRRARLYLKAALGKRFEFQLEPDFAGDKVTVQDAYLETKFAPWARLRAGRFKTPFGIERLQSSRHLLFVERGLPDNLVPSRDSGFQLLGDLAQDRLGYHVAVLNGAPDGDSSQGDVNDAFDVAVRLFATPFAGSMYSPLRGAGAGVAGTWGREQGDADNDQLTPYRTGGRATFFRWRGDTVADGEHWRLSPQATWYEGPFGFLGEYVVSDQQVADGSERARIANTAWQLRASWMLTGEDASYGGVVPASPFDFGGGHWGAWEAALRWASLDVDGEAFRRGFADPDESARHADAIAVAVNWYLTRYVGIYVDFEHTMFGGGAPGGDRDDEDVFLTRMQLEF